ncbi:MAG: hypothetical protein ACRD96_00295, partial [Bryobacteraceae bacterium]
VVNAYSQQPAPSTVGRGGLVQINGLNLGPPEGATATGTPWPSSLGGAEALLNGVAMPLYSVTPAQILAQVPFDAPNGIVDVVVRRGGAESRPARFNVVAIEPSVRTADDSGFGEAAGTPAGQTLSIVASGLGLTDPRIDTGAAAAADSPAKPALPVVVHVGGIRSSAVATYSSKRAGEFDIQIEVPPQTRPGDLIGVTVVAPNAMRPANRTVFQRMRTPDVQYLALPEGAPELRTLNDTDLNGSYLVGAAARNAEGCYPAALFDLVRKKSALISDCLTAANANLPSPMTAPNEAAVLGSLVGPPPAGAAPNAPISSKVQIFNSAMGEPFNVDLPAPASTLLAVGGGLGALVPGNPPRLLPIDSQTGQVGDPLPAGAAG